MHQVIIREDFQVKSTLIGGQGIHISAQGQFNIKAVLQGDIHLLCSQLVYLGQCCSGNGLVGSVQVLSLHFDGTELNVGQTNIMEAVRGFLEVFLSLS